MSGVAIVVPFCKEAQIGNNLDSDCLAGGRSPNSHDAERASARRKSATLEFLRQRTKIFRLFMDFLHLFLRKLPRFFIGQR
jgi:hypothetical protein